MRRLIDLLYPPQCVGCSRVLTVDAQLCAECDRAVAVLEPGCIRCCEPGEFRRDICPRCQKRPPPFSRAFAPFAHEGPIAHAIHQFKYEDHPELAPALGRLLASSARDFLSRAPRVVAHVPLHRSRYRERRYDQAELLARALAQATGRAFAPGHLSRVRKTERQVGRSEADRDANLRGAFTASDVQGLHLLLVDDVFTTGATARAAAHALLFAGAAEVQILTLARAFTLS